MGAARQKNLPIYGWIVWEDLGFGEIPGHPPAHRFRLVNFSGGQSLLAFCLNQYLPPPPVGQICERISKDIFWCGEIYQPVKIYELKATTTPQQSKTPTATNTPTRERIRRLKHQRQPKHQHRLKRQHQLKHQQRLKHQRDKHSYINSPQYPVRLQLLRQNVNEWVGRQFSIKGFNKRGFRSVYYWFRSLHGFD